MKSKSYRIPKKLLDELKRVAAFHKRSVSSIVREVLEAALKAYRE